MILTRWESSDAIVRQLVPAVITVVVFTVVLGLVYPLVVTGIAQVASTTRPTARSSSTTARRSGSALIGQQFTEPKYF